MADKPLREILTDLAAGQARLETKAEIGHETMQEIKRHCACHDEARVLMNRQLAANEERLNSVASQAHSHTAMERAIKWGVAILAGLGTFFGIFVDKH
ncbi:MAG: hypothetical protein WC455_12240 [Dehalococcoidia bacterium]|jgi:hypothetical protein